MYNNYFSNFGRPLVPDDLCKDSAPRHSRFWRRRFLKVFTIYGHGSHLGQRNMTILAIFRSLNLRRLHMKFEQHWPGGFKGDVVWNSQQLSHTNVWCPYKCIGKQTWPCRKKVKRQCTIIILAISVDLCNFSRPPWFVQRFSPKAFSVLKKKIFKCFYHIWAWWPSLSTDRDHFSNLSFPRPKEAPYEIRAKLAQRFQKRSRLKMLTDWRTEGRMDDGRKVITIAHPEHSSGELKTKQNKNTKMALNPCLAE